MKPITDIVACVVDHGRFVHVARTLGKTFAKVYYTSPEERDCPLAREAAIGIGFDEITRTKSLWKVKDECDLFIFPDIGFEWEQKELHAQGKAVWGPGFAGPLESNRGLFLKELAQTSLPIAPHTVVEGLTNLRLLLKDSEDVYVKVDKFRGDWETMHWTTWDDMEGQLDAYAVRFGPLKELITFYVFDKIETKIEDGVDSHFIGGKWPSVILHGMENKDKSYIGTLQKMADLPEEVRCVNEQFGPVLERVSMGAPMKFSTEVRITEDGKSFFIDPTCRFGSPPSQGECLLIQNLPEIIARGAIEGVCVDPEGNHSVVVQAAVFLDGDRQEWNQFRLDDQVDEALKGGFCCRVDDKLVLTPITEYPSKEVGYLCATGESIRAAIEELRDLKDMLPDGMHCEFASLTDVLKEIQEAEDKGMEFSVGQATPEPSLVLE